MKRLEEVIKITSDIKKKIYKPIYLLFGDESFYINKITKFISENILTEEEKAFNQTVLYGKDIDVRVIDNEIRRYPMMSNYRVVIIKEAQYVRDLEKLDFYTNKPSKKTILVLNYNKDKIDKRKKFFKGIEKNGLIFESKKMYDNEVQGWITNYISKKGYSIVPVAAKLLADSLGTNLHTIVNEIEKLFIAMTNNNTKAITVSLIEEHIGISKDFNVFELSNAVGKKDITKSFQIMKYFSQQSKDASIFQSISILFNFFSKVLLYQFFDQKGNRNAVASHLGVNPYFIKDYQTAANNYSAGKVITIISLLREYDAKAKGVDNVSTSHSELFKELLFKILH